MRLLRFAGFMIIAMFSWNVALSFADDLDPHYRFGGLKPPASPYKNTQSQFHNDLFTGSAGYEYKIKVPPGVKGLQPDLSLSYNSHAAKGKAGWVGAGWQLPLSYIQRDINFTRKDTSDDKFELYLDGAKHDLVFVAADGLYHSKNETYMRVEFRGSGAPNSKGAYWVVYTKDGTEYRFGYNPDAETPVNTSDSSMLPAFIGRWSLDRIKDSNDNCIYFTYSENPTSNDRGAVYLSKIEYNNEKRRLIEFILEGSDKPDAYLTIEQGSEVREARRLGEIRISVNGQLARKYMFTYALNETRTKSLLTAIAEYGSDGLSALPSTRFEYKPLDKGFNSEVSWYTPGERWIRKSDTDNDVIVDTFDVNGDGLPDLVSYEPNHWDIWLNTKTGFSPSNLLWGLPGGWEIRDIETWQEGNIPNTRSSPIDLNGDGHVDFLRADGNSSLLFVLNNGSGFGGMNTWTLLTTAWIREVQEPDDKAANVQQDFFDINGDGLPDLVKKEGNGWHIWRNTGSGFVDYGVWPVSYTDGKSWIEDFTRGVANVQVTHMDINGDGLPDIVDGNSGTWKIYLNTGSNFIYAGDWPTGYSNCITDLDSSGNVKRDLIDINGDGLPDIVNPVTGSYTWEVQFNTGDGFTPKISWSGPTSDGFTRDAVPPGGDCGDDTCIRRDIFDIDGDGVVDVVRKTAGDWKVYTNKSGQADLLTKITEPLGGTITISYSPSVQYNNTRLPFNYWVVTSLTNNNGMSGAHALSFTTSLTYSDGLYDFPTREFRGFGQVVETRPDSTKVIHSFHQDEAKKGKEFKKEIRNSADVTFAVTENTYSESSANGVYISNLTRTNEYTYDGNPVNPKLKRIEYQNYDQFGNTGLVIDYGDVDLSGDETYTYYEYWPTCGSSPWIVDKAKHTYVTGSAGGTKLRETYPTYDNSASCVSKGNLTREEKAINAGSNAVTTNTYDSYGNRTSTTDAEGRVTSIQHDSTYNTYPVAEYNANNQLSTRAFNALNGELAQETDPNAFTTRYGYDVFGRKISEVRPYDSDASPTTVIQYVMDGTAPEVIVVSKRETAGGGTLDTVSAIDGFGKLIQTKTESENPSNKIAVDVFYDFMGRVKKQSNPYLTDGSNGYSTPNTSIPGKTYDYDAIGRPVAITNQDGTLITRVFDHWTVTETDENGHSRVYTFDASQRLKKVVENNATQSYTTNYQFNPIGELVTVVDAVGNTTTMQYDMLGRRTQLSDPDLGTRAYGYDKVGNIISQTDAKGGVTLISYDPLNRKTLVDYPVSPDIRFSYDQPVSYDQPAIGTLSQVTDAAGTVSYQYDQRLRKMQETRTMDGRAWTTQWSYDSMDRPVSMTYPGGEVVTFNYNSQGKLDSIPGIVSGLDYNAGNQLTNKVYGNGKSTTYTYHSQNQRLAGLASSGLQNFSYTHDNVGNIKSIVDAAVGRTENYTYDNLDRLLTAGDSGYGIQYQYNAIGNMTSMVKDGMISDYTYGTTNVRPHAVTGVSSLLPMVASFVIDNGAATTLSNTVTLNNISMGDPTHYMASENNSFTGASWQPYSTAPSFTLSTGYSTKTVYFKVKNADGESNVKSDSITETYTQVETVVINPEPAAMNAVAPWTLTGPNSYSQTGTGDQSLPNMTAGNYTLTWVGVAGREKPAPSTVLQTLASGSTVTFTGIYQTATGTVTINPNPNSLNAPWRIAGPNNYNLTGTGDRTLTNMTAGAYTMSWGQVNNWNLPAPAIETKMLAIGGAQTFTGTYAQAPIIQVSPASLNFGSVPVGLTKELTFWLQNIGTATLAGSMSTALPFGVTSGGPYSLDPGKSQQVTVRYSPTQSGSHQGTVTFAGQTAMVSLIGSATGSIPSLPGGVLAWGRNDEGQLGDGVTMGHKTPFQVPGLNDVKAIAGGYQHTLAVKNNGTVWSWGYNWYGQLGNGTTIDSKVPVQVANLTDVIAVAGGRNHTLALKNDGTVWAWGYGWSGELGNGTNTGSNIPVQVLNLTNVIAVAAGSSHSLAVKKDGTVWAWGSNSYGQLGNGTTTTSNIPVPVSSLTGVTAVTSGSGNPFSVALKNDGTVWAWGWGLNGELGNGTNTSSNVPIPVSNLTGVTAVAAGSFHSLALKSDNTVWAWGVSWGLGNGNWVNNSNIPLQVLNINTATEVAAGYFHSGALLADKTVNAWGRNEDGQLGDGTTIGRNIPVPTQGISDVKAIAASGMHTIALKNDGSVWTWGNNGYGQLGDGLKTASPTPGPVQNLTNVIGLSGGFRHSVALKSDKTVWTFGLNNYGQLGDGTNVSSNMPVQVTGLTDVKAVSAGGEHTLALKNDGTAMAWGSGGYGKLGNWTGNSSFTPVQVSDLTDIIAIAAGGSHSMALKSDGTVWTWGSGGYGQLGDGTFYSSNGPVKVLSLADVVAVSAGSAYSRALKSDGTVWTWGLNFSGELGNGTNTSSNVPVQVSNLTGITAVAGGSSHTLALKNDGTVWAWGIGGNGQLGDATWYNRNIPAQAWYLTNIIAIAGGDNHSMAVKSDGTVYTWGSSAWGQLGRGTFSTFSAPVALPGLAGVAGIAAGGEHSLAIGSQVGMGAVTIDPNPNTINAPWTLTGPDGYVTNGTGDRTIGVSLAGNYTLKWGDVTAYRKPASETKAVTIGGAITFTGAYQPIVGTVVVNPEPNGANAPWNLRGPFSYNRSGNGDLTLTDMIIGYYTIYWNPTSGYERPTPYQVVQTLAEGQTLTITGTYKAATGTVTITPEPGTVNAPWTLSGSYGYSLTGAGAATVTGRNSGSYTLTWGDVPGWTKPWPTTQSMSMVPGGAITFSGIYQPAGVADTWQSQTVGTNHLIGVAYSPDLDLFAAVGWGGTILTSPDGATWTPRTSGTTNTLEKIAFGLGKYVAVGAGGTILTSTDGLNWQPRTSGTTGALYGVAYGNNLFVAVGQNGVILTSTNGETWTLQSSGTPGHFYGVGYGSGMYVAVGVESRIVRSLNGITWTPQNSGVPNWLWRVTYGKENFVAIGGTGAAMTSPDGIAWKRNTMGMNFNGLAFVNGLFMAVGPGGIIATSPDGMRWQGHASGVTTELEDVAYGNNKLVVVGRSGTILLSGAIHGSVLVEATPDHIHAPWSLAGPGGYSITGLGDYALMVAQTGDYTLTWSGVSGWTKPSPAQVTQTLTEGSTVTFTGVYQVATGTVIVIGDLDGNRMVDIRDAILAMQVISGMTPAQINRDASLIFYEDKIGMREAIYILQKVAGVR